MTEITVRPLGEDDWQEYRTVRLDALNESPEVFVATAAEEQDYDEDFWRLRMRRSARLLAERGGASVGVVSLGRPKEAEDDKAGELFGLWVRPEARGSGVATRLVKHGAALAREQGHSQLVYWVGTDNGRAVSFASGLGFLPTDYRRPMRVASEADGEEEIAFVLPLGEEVGPQARI